MPNVESRIGLGFDSHPLAAGRPLILAGIRVPFDQGPSGHSDADVLAHAVMDALLGATGRGNIGERFPDSDPALEGADSCELLAEAWRELRAAGWEVVNLDCVVIAERPRLGPYVPNMRRRLAEILAVDVERVNVKPKTAGGLGDLGRGEGIAAVAQVLLNRDSACDARGPAGV